MFHACADFDMEMQVSQDQLIDASGSLAPREDTLDDSLHELTRVVKEEDYDLSLARLSSWFPTLPETTLSLGTEYQDTDHGAIFDLPSEFWQNSQSLIPQLTASTDVSSHASSFPDDSILPDQASLHRAPNSIHFSITRTGERSLLRSLPYQLDLFASPIDWNGNTAILPHCGPSRLDLSRIDLNLNLGVEGKPYSYAQLITYAIAHSPLGKLTLSEIYDWCLENFPYFKKQTNSGWKNSVRHNLSLNKSFIKVPRHVTESGKGAYWALSDECLCNGITTTSQARRRQRSQSALEPRMLADSDNTIPTISRMRSVSAATSNLYQPSRARGHAVPNSSLVRESSSIRRELLHEPLESIRSSMALFDTMSSFYVGTMPYGYPEMQSMVDPDEITTQEYSEPSKSKSSEPSSHQVDATMASAQDDQAFE